MLISTKIQNCASVFLYISWCQEVLCPAPPNIQILNSKHGNTPVRVCVFFFFNSSCPQPSASSAAIEIFDVVCEQLYV